MSAPEDLTDAELAQELESFGEKVQLPIKRNKRPILLKKLNHLRVRARAQDVDPSEQKGRSGRAANSTATAGSRSPGRSSRTSTSRVSQNASSSSLLRSRPGQTSLEAFSSDESDTDLPMMANNGRRANNTFDFNNRSTNSMASTSSHSTTRTRTNPVNHNEKKRSPQLADGILRTLRRRTGGDNDLPPRRSRGSDVFEVSATGTERGNHSQSFVENNFEDDGLDKFSSLDNVRTPSPARSRLYPNLSQLAPPSQSNDGFESSDSDPEASTYEVENKSVNTSFPSFHHGREPVNSFMSSSYSSSFQDSPSGGLASIRYRRQYNGTGRVQQYKSAITEHLPHCLVAVAMIFFITLSVLYIANHKDFFLSWLNTSSNMGVGDELLVCSDGIPKEGCYAQEEVDTAIKYVADVFQQLSVRKGDVMCENLRPGEEVMAASLLENKIFKNSVASTNAMRLYECCLKHILANPHWNLRPMRADGSEATTVAQVDRLEAKVASMSFWCRLRRSFTTVLYGLFLFFTLIAGATLISMYVKYRLKKQEQEQREVFAMVEKIIEVLQEHYERTKGDDCDEPQYLAVQHVRDQLLPPAVRRTRQPIWDKAVEFISANESRIRLETRLIHGDEFDVWHWLQPSVHNGKIWQGQAFGEASSNNSNQRMYSPTQCLKIRNMFDSNVESEEGWEQNVVDAILEKCRGIEHVVHAFVDVESQEGCVYIKCSSLEAAGRARLALHGWWFDGRLVTVKHLKTDHYHKRWPEAKTANTALQPSTNQMKSLAQPFHRSSLEMT